MVCKGVHYRRRRQLLEIVRGRGLSRIAIALRALITAIVAAMVVAPWIVGQCDARDWNVPPAFRGGKLRLKVPDFSFWGGGVTGASRVFVLRVRNRSFRGRNTPWRVRRWCAWERFLRYYGGPLEVFFAD
jgi:hypothetical protein